MRYTDRAFVENGDLEEFSRFITKFHLERVTRVADMELDDGTMFDQGQAPAAAQRSLEMDLEKLLKSGFRSDIAFEVQGTKFRGHKAILSARNQYFHAMLAGQMRESIVPDSEVVIVDVEPDTFDAVLRYLYTSSIDFTQAGLDLLSVLELSHRYLIEDLRKQVTYFLVNHIDMENVIALFEGAMLLECADLKLACLDFIVR